MRPSQKVGRSSKFQVPPEPSFFGFVGGSFGNVTSYVMSFPEPGSDGLERKRRFVVPHVLGSRGLEGVATERRVALAERFVAARERRPSA